jgi:hypothetical protein
MNPKTQPFIIFENKCNCIVDESVLRKAIVWFSKNHTYKHKKITMHGRYPAVSIGKTKIHIHRLIVCYIQKRILKRNEHVHHINHNRLDSSIENLEILSAFEHISSHNKGKTLTLEHRAKIVACNKRRDYSNSKLKLDICFKALSNMVESGKSVNSIAVHFDCDWSSIKYRIDKLKNNPELLNND